MDRRLLDLVFLALIAGPIAYLEFMTAAYSEAVGDEIEPGFPNSLENSDRSAPAA
jgi:hypothetical protein